MTVEFSEIFDCFFTNRNKLKVIHTASADKNAKPNSAPKMLLDVCKPNALLYLDYPFTQTFHNVLENPTISVSFMTDSSFRGYRLTGKAIVIESGEAYEKAKKAWEKRLISYEADRILERVRGGYSAKEAENQMPDDFKVIQLTATEASVVKPDRVLRAKKNPHA